MYASFLGISGALHLDIFQQPAQRVFFSNLLVSLVSLVCLVWLVGTGPWMPDESAERKAQSAKRKEPEDRSLARASGPRERRERKKKKREHSQK